MKKSDLQKQFEEEQGREAVAEIPLRKFYLSDYGEWCERKVLKLMDKAEAYDRLMSGGKKAIEETCKAFKISDIGEFSDGFHTFNSLYHQRAVLFATLVNTYSSHSWKSYRHEDGQICFGGGWFIVGIDTPKGSYTYHYENKYWDMFNCQTYENAKHWDGHTDDDVERLLTLPDGWEEK